MWRVDVPNPGDLPRTKIIIATALAALTLLVLGSFFWFFWLPELPVNAAKRDLALSLNIKLNSIELVREERVVWPDGCLGLPSGGSAHLQRTVLFQAIASRFGPAAETMSIVRTPTRWPSASNRADPFHGPAFRFRKKAP